MYDVVIVGGGPAGLSAALMLGRCRRRVLLIDSGHPRNAASRALHGYLTRDGIPPCELLRLGREELAKYNLECRAATVTAARPCDGTFEVDLGDGSTLRARKLLLATGVVDKLPAIPGMQECFGRSVFHCPYCDGWEVRDRPLAVYGKGRAGIGLSLALRNWSSDVLLCTDAPRRLTASDRHRLARHGVAVREERVERLVHDDDGRLREVVFATGSAAPRAALFFNTGQYQRSELAASLGCAFTRRGAVKTGNLGESCVAGVYVAGDASRDVQFVVVAAAEGAKVAYAINTALQQEADVAAPAS